MNELVLNGTNRTMNLHRSPVGVRAEVVLFTIVAEERKSAKKKLPTRELQVALVRRRTAPYEGSWALPGGFCAESEPILGSAVRVLRERTGLSDVALEFYNAYGDPDRDPRGWHISHAFVALSNDVCLRSRLTEIGDEDVRLFPVNEALLLPLAFDHVTLLKDALDRIRRQMLTTTIAKRFLPEEFTISELYQVIESVVPEFEEKNFIRKITSTRSRKGILEEARDRSGELKTSNRYSQRSAQLYRFTDFEPRLSVYG